MKKKIIKLQSSINYEYLESHAFFDCEYYEECLLLAARKDWAGFSCCQCPIFKAFQRKKDANKNRGVKKFI